MANPANTRITIDSASLNAFSTQVGVASMTDATGMPMMGSMTCSMDFSADVHDTKNVPFATVKKFFDLANLPTKDKIKDVKIEFWTDENQSDVICSMSFKGWLSAWMVSSGGGSNHVLSISIQPALDQQNYHALTLGN